MSGFRLLAIIPLQGCNEKFRKNLTIGTPYKFSNNLFIELDNEKITIERVLIDKESDINDLYKLNNDINIEVSAIVGLNGSGKSALIEILYYFIYAISIHNDKKILLEEHSNIIENKIKNQEKDTEKLYNDSKKVTTLNLFKILKDNDLSIYKKDFEGITSSQTLIKNALKKRSEYLYDIKRNDQIIEQLIKEKLAVSLVYETSEGIHSISFSDGNVKYYKYNSEGKPEENNDFFFDPFFYSISLNYSHHSLNSKVIGNWINSLFHKNDGYATPLVINPMRDEGNFNINRELHLSNERIMSNLTFEVANKSEVSLLQKYDLQKFLFSVKNNFTLIKCEGFIDKNYQIKSDITKYYVKEEFDNLVSVKLVRLLLGNNFLNYYTNYQDYALGYLESKIDKIKNSYSQLFRDKNNNFNDAKFKSFLRKDKSHITKKLRQTINFISKTNNLESIWNNEIHHYDNTKLSLEQFRTWLSECNKDYKKLNPSLLMDFALPGFFNIDFEITAKNKKVVRLSELSSGEQQMIFNINTITYHLYNLQSVHAVKEENEFDEDGIERLAYKNVSIILDEIEIYYHPEMQRQFTFNLLNALENVKVKGQKGIESIHIIYLTHSPFILSDVLSSNILRLNNGKIEKTGQETFASNVHDLLANDFFLENGFMGELAKKRIEETILFLNYKINEKKLQEINNNINIVEDNDEIDLLKLKIENLKDQVKLVDKDYHKKIINLIGEPIIKNKLQKMYYDVFQEDDRNNIKEEILSLAQKAGLDIKFNN